LRETMKLVSAVFCLSKLSSGTLEKNTYHYDDYYNDSDLNSTFYSSSSSSSIESHISGGHEARPHSYPFMAMMLYHQGSFPERKCGGSILNENWILTAAHCCKSLLENDRIMFRIGAHRDEGCDFEFCENESSNWKPITGAEDLGTPIYVKNKLIHPEYEKIYKNRNQKRLWALKNDFCLIETNTTMNFGRHVGKISIADENFTTEDKSCFVIGWGFVRGLGKTGDASKYLLKAKTRRTQKFFAKCNDVEENNAFCMDSKNKGTCKGDNGGPLFCKKGGQNFLVGVTSYGRKECPSPFGVYADVRKVYNWINKNISKRMKPLRTSEKCFTGFTIETTFEKRARKVKPFAVNSECDCVEKCRNDSKCHAFTFVKGRRKNCYIKTRLYRRPKPAGEKNIIFGIKLKK